MPATFLMSYPQAGSSPLQSGESESVSRAMREWLSLCDHITRCGGRILVLDPPAEAASPWILTRAAHFGELFGQPSAGGSAVFLMSKGPHISPALEASTIPSQIERAGLTLRVAAHRWAGQVDVISISHNRYILTHGAASSRESVSEVRALLPPGARVLEVPLREGFSDGAGCLCALASPGGDHVVLAYADALIGTTLEEISRFAGGEIQVIPLTAEDALAHATEMLCVRGNLILPSGLSSSLRGMLVRRGFTLTEVELTQLLGTAGIGPRRLVNELYGYILSESAPSYVLRREELHRMVPPGELKG